MRTDGRGGRWSGSAGARERRLVRQGTVSGPLAVPDGLDESSARMIARKMARYRAEGHAVSTSANGPETVDLSPFMREDLLLNLPAHPRCDREGGRVCNARPSELAPSETKPRADWSALDKLKLKS